MIKVIAFDMVGVLVSEKDIKLNKTEEKLERMFGDNYNDSDYMTAARRIIDKDSTIMRTTEELIDKIYEVRDKDIFKKIKERYPDIKIVIATNHVSFVRNYLGENLNVEYLDDLLISAEMHKIKPNKDFYEHILNKYNINPHELLFLDDNNDNIKGAKNLGIKTITVNKDTDLFKEITNMLL